MTMQHPTYATTYTCPMHPEVRQAQSGDCPKCGMHLVPAEGQQQVQMYTCTMHPEVRQAQPGDCPTCGMHLVSAEDAPK